MNKNALLKNRIEYYDILRIISTFSVVLIHVSAWFELNMPATGVKIYNLCSSLVKWAVPIFVMISGALLLNTNRTIKQIYNKNILRIITAFIFWSIIYAFVNNGNNVIRPSILATILDGPGHFWFLYMIVGLYMIIPILDKIIESDKISRYFIFLSFLFAFLIPFLILVYSTLTGRQAQVISAKIDQMNMYLPLGYSGYFVLGYYLSRHSLSKKTEITIYAFAVLGIILTLIYAFDNDSKKIIWQVVRWDYLTPIILFESIALFILCKNHYKTSIMTMSNIIEKVSKYTFGIYLVHILVMNFLFYVIGIVNIVGSSILSVLVISIATFLISLLVSAILNKIPFINKYIV